MYKPGRELINYEITNSRYFLEMTKVGQQQVCSEMNSTNWRFLLRGKTEAGLTKVYVEDALRRTQNARVLISVIWVVGISL